MLVNVVLGHAGSPHAADPIDALQALMREIRLAMVQESVVDAEFGPRGVGTQRSPEPKRRPERCGNDRSAPSVDHSILCMEFAAL